MNEPVTHPIVARLEGPKERFYRSVLLALDRGGVPFLVSGTYALQHYTGLARPTKDLDLFLDERDLPAAQDALREGVGEVSCYAPHWLWKVERGDHFVDLIFSSGNGIAEVDRTWFEHAEPSQLLGVPVLVVPAEELIWSKSFIMERERYDGADVAHLLHARARSIQWDRLVARFGEHWRVLLAHLVLFGFVYPGRRHHVPPRVLEELTARLGHELDAPASPAVCRGPLLSREQYLSDVQEKGYRDARLPPDGSMSHGEIAAWHRRMEEDA